MEIIVPSEKEYIRLKGKTKAQFQNGKINDCCKQPENIYLADKDEKVKLEVWRCRVCGRNHYVAHAEPGRFGITRLEK